MQEEEKPIVSPEELAAQWRKQQATWLEEEGYTYDASHSVYVAPVDSDL